MRLYLTANHSSSIPSVSSWFLAKNFRYGQKFVQLWIIIPQQRNDEKFGRWFQKTQHNMLNNMCQLDKIYTNSRKRWNSGKIPAGPSITTWHMAKTTTKPGGTKLLWMVQLVSFPNFISSREFRKFCLIDAFCSTYCIECFGMTSLTFHHIHSVALGLIFEVGWIFARFEFFPPKIREWLVG